MILVWSSCRTPLKQEIWKEVRYASEPRCVMDVYLPADRNEQTPFIILIHPGAWMSGEKEILSRLSDSLMLRGIAVANINHTYASADTHIAHLMDNIHSAIDFCVVQSSTWHTRSKAFAIGGPSSGGHLALMYAYVYDTTGQIATVMGLAAPSDVADTTWLRAMQGLGITEKVGWMAGTPYELGSRADTNYYNNSPVNIIKQVPTFLIHGTADDVVPFAQSEKMMEQLKAQHVPCYLFPLEGLGHEIGYQHPDKFSKMMERLVYWLEQYTRNQKAYKFK